MRQLSFDDRLHNETQQVQTNKRRIIWSALRKKLKLHRRSLSIFLIIAIIALGLGTWLSQPGTITLIDHKFYTSTQKLSVLLGLKVNNVYAEGRSQTKLNDLLKAINVKRGDPIINFDVAEAKIRVESLGWVSKAHISRNLPDSIHVRITERKPFALWQNNGKIVLIDRNGAIISDSQAQNFNHLPRIVGQDARETAPRLFESLAEEPKLYNRVLAAVRVGKRRWDIVFYGGLRVHLPEKNLRNAWSRLAIANVENNFFDSDITLIDLRLPDRMILRINKNTINNGETT